MPFIENWSFKVHIPVLLKETIKALDPKPGENFIDCTFGFGGHSLAILEMTAPDGIVLGIEWDDRSLDSLPAEIRQNKRLIIENDSYANVEAIVKKHNFNKIGGILFDLGMSSWHLDESRKGFSFSKDELLDMRYSSGGTTAAEIINKYPVPDLERIFKDYGQEGNAGKIVETIEKARSRKPIETTRQLAALIEKIPGPPRKRPGLARIFQALRIEVNREFENVEKGIGDGFNLLEDGGRMAVVSFHSLEDGIVKRKFVELAKSGRAKLIFKKPVVASRQEISKNPRARSAKLRAIMKTV
ncbi:MAG: 16S rRNA (cytosine(1402)-N(4))-methyltransferase RsmH [Candidatus Nealsonbacteria bacterium DGGOD1a]|nr:MAG: 16S rRNA (cytosine(1402)-N(4))-methyltransferase RsmH [Candidatus Nealsonbacteria bacterium DGGOD1a]